MREFNLHLGDEMKTGLRAERNQARSFEALVNLIPTPLGLRARDAWVNLTEGYAPAWPFPHIVKKGRQVFVGGESSFGYFSTGGVVEYAVTDIEGTPATITAGGFWNVAALAPNSFVATNGACTIWRHPFTPAGTVILDDVVVPQAVGIHMNGRLVAANLDITGSALYKVLDDHQEYEDVAGFLGAMPSNTEGLIYWSTLVGGDFFALFDEEALIKGPFNIDGGYDENRPYFRDLLQRNDWGLIQVPFSGDVHSVLPLESAVVAYSDNGIAYMPDSPDTGGLGMIHLDEAGALAVASNGTHTAHFFISPDLDLCLLQVAEGPRVIRIGYREYIGQLEGSIRLSYNPLRKEVWISGSNKSYVFTESGLGGPMTSTVSGMVLQEGTVYISGEDDEPVEVGYEIFGLKTTPLDMVESGYKHATTIQMGAGVGPSLPLKRVKGRVGSGPWVPFNSNGACFPCSSFKAASVQITGLIKPEDWIRWIELRYQAEDLRFRRGTKGIVRTDEEEDY